MPPCDNRRQYGRRRVHPAAREVRDYVVRNHRSAALIPYHTQRAPDRYVVDVVAQQAPP